MKIVEGLRLSLNVNSLFDIIGLMESEEGSFPGNGVIKAIRSSGCSIMAGLKYFLN